MSLARNPGRHDLVWLHPDAAAWSAWGAEPPVVADWIARGLPLVTARRHADYPQELNLGFTLPAVERRQRVSVVAKPESVQHWHAPLSLLDVIAVLPESWRSGLASLDLSLRREGFDARVFGSAVTFFFTREACLRPDSDLDLLLDCRQAEQVDAALHILKAAAPPPRLDGELRFPSGWSVSWRELAMVWPNREAQVLAKSNEAVALLKVSQLGMVQ